MLSIQVMVNGKKIYEHIAALRHVDLPEAQIEIISNGDVLNKIIDEQKLFEVGLSRILIRQYDGPEEEKQFRLRHIPRGIFKKRSICN